MNIKVMAVVAAAVLLGGCGKATVKNGAPTVTPVPTVEEKKIDGLSVVQVDGGLEIWVETPDRVSAVEFKIATTPPFRIISFIPNRDVFDAVLKNSGSGTEWEASLGAMKTTDVLPKGRLMLGKIVGSGSGKLKVSETKLIGPGVGGTPVQTKVTDIEFEVAAK